MALRELTSKEIDEFIEHDRIIMVGCRNPNLSPLHGKFVRASKPIEEGSNEYSYSFCPFKKGVNLPFLPANYWLLKEEDSTSHKKAVEEALSSAFRKKRKRKVRG